MGDRREVTFAGPPVLDPELIFGPPEFEPVYLLRWQLPDVIPHPSAPLTFLACGAYREELLLDRCDTSCESLSSFRSVFR